MKVESVIAINMLPKNDFTLPHGILSASACTISMPFEIDYAEDLKYLFNKYLITVERKKPNLRLAKNLKELIDLVQTTQLCENAMSLSHNTQTDTNKRTYNVEITNDKKKTKNFFNKYLK